MWIRISKHFQFEYLKEPLIKYHIHENNLSMNYAKLIKGSEAKLTKYSEYFASDTKSYSQRFIDLGIYYCCSGNLTKGREAFIKAITIYPSQTRHYLNLFASFLGANNFRMLKQAKNNFFRRSFEFLNCTNAGVATACLKRNHGHKTRQV
jgi:hypothetical protein